jgi:hypothetical protein
VSFLKSVCAPNISGSFVPNIIFLLIYIMYLSVSIKLPLIAKSG